MSRQNNFRLQFRCSGNHRVEVIHFKPQQHTVPGRDLRITNATMMMLNVPVMQLKH